MPDRWSSRLPVLVLVLVVAGGTAWSAEEHQVALSVEEKGFSPAEIEVPVGAKVRFQVTNKTSVAIEFESFELNRERVVQPGQTVSVYVSGLDAGRYEFFDDFNKARHGTLIVK
jgi:plastocyanin